MEGEFCFRERATSGSRLLSVCDADLLGKTLKFGEVDFDVSASFYGEEKANIEKVLEMMERCNVANVVGKKIVDLLISEGIVDKDCVLWIGGMPHVQIMR
jgi:hypothetical protein